MCGVPRMCVAYMPRARFESRRANVHLNDTLYVAKFREIFNVLQKHYRINIPKIPLPCAFRFDKRDRCITFSATCAVRVSDSRVIFRFRYYLKQQISLKTGGKDVIHTYYHRLIAIKRPNNNLFNVNEFDVIVGFIDIITSFGVGS